MERPSDSRTQAALDEIVGQSAVLIAQQIQSASTWAKSEMDLQIEVAGILKDFARKAKINLSDAHHNVTIATGRPDSVYGSVIVEYKEPGNLSPKKDAANNKKVIDQLKQRFYDMRRGKRTISACLARTSNIRFFSICGKRGRTPGTRRIQGPSDFADDMKLW